MKPLVLLLATSALAACATTGTTPPEVAEQTATVATAAAGPVTPAPAEAPQLGSFGFDMAGMDRTVDPGDSFYDFANGTWARTTPIPADRSNYGMFTMLEDLSNERTREILDEQARLPGSKIGDFYASFMDRAAVDAKGFQPLAPVLNEIKAADSREALAGIPLEGLISDGYAFLVEQLFLARQSGCRVREVPIIFVERREGASKVSGAVLLESAIVPWRLRLKR